MKYLLHVIVSLAVFATSFSASAAPRSLCYDSATEALQIKKDCRTLTQLNGANFNQLTSLKSFIASVGDAGTLLLGTPGTAVQKFGAGDFDVVFPESVANCVPAVTQGRNEDGTIASDVHFIAIVNGGTVGVFIKDSTGIPVDAGFHLTLTCQ